MAPFYVTTPIYYVNDLPHIGHIYTTVVADTIARYRRLSGDEVYFLTGTDEHGQKIERAAAKEGVEPMALADRVVSRYHELWRQYEMSHDDFIRTSEERHQIGVRALISRLEASGDLYLDGHDGWYCTSCETFYTEKELLPGNICPVHETEAEWHSEENVFFRLSKYEDRLLEWYDSSPCPVQPRTRANEIRAFVTGGLRDLSVSRANLEWGIPFPGYPGQTTYVWLDALTNYISALGFGRDTADTALYQTFWDPGETKINLIGKDILRQHAVYWPAFLMSAGLPLPSTVWAHGWWLRDKKKISKSAGGIVRPDDLVEAFGPDTLRYFLMREMVFGQDAQFSDEAFVDRFNSDLANDLGNSLSRLVTLSSRAFDGQTPPEACDGNPLIEAAEKATAEYHAAMGEFAFHRALEALWRLLSESTQYMVAREPWKALKDAESAAGVSRVLWNSLEALRIVATGLLPFMPQTAPRLLTAIGVDSAPESLEAMAWGGLPTGVDLPEKQSLFPRIDKEKFLASSEETAAEAQVEEESMITIDEFARVDLRIGTVTAAEAVPKSEKLVQVTVDLGDETRTVVAGIARAYQAEDLVGKQIVIVANLKPAKLMGIESQGMVLAASVDGKPTLLQPESAVLNGSKVT